MIRCPACNTLLFRRTFGDVEVDGCPSCGGVWLDKGELQALARDPAALLRIHADIRAGIQPSIAPERTGLCPRCREPIGPFEYTRFPGLRLDRCRACEGVWLDAGEAKALAERIAGAPEAAPRAEVIPPAAVASPAIAARFGPVVPGAAGRAGVAASAAAGAAARPEARPAGAAPADATRTADLPVVRGRVLNSVPQDGGVFGALERGIRFVGAAYHLALERPALLLPVVLGGLLQLLLAGAGAVWFLANGRGLGRNLQHLEAQGQQHVLSLVVLSIGAVFLIQLVNMTVLGMTVNLVDAHLKGLEPRLGVAVRDVLKNAWGVIALAIIGTIVEMLTAKGNRRHRSFVGDMIRDAVSAAWTALSFLLMPVIIVEDVGLGRALTRVRQIHARGLLQIAVGEVGLRLIAGATSFAVFVLVALAGLALAPLSLVELAVLGGGFFALLAVLGVLHSFARGAYYTCLYLWAVAVERAPEPTQAVVPAPLATALLPPE